MEFSEDSGSATYRIKGYGKGYIHVNDQEYHYPIFIMPEKLIAPWPVKAFSELTQADFAAMLLLEPQVVLIGRGFEFANEPNIVEANMNESNPRESETRKPYIKKSNKMLSPTLFHALTERGIGVEVMSTASACRTYTILMAEGRNVAAGLFI